MTLKARNANERDIFLYFRWTNDKLTRQNSFQTEAIEFDIHEKWFLNKIKDSNALLLVFENSAGLPVGQVRIEHTPTENIIGVSIDAAFRGKGFSTEMLKVACTTFFGKFKDETKILAYIKSENKASIKTFENAGFTLLSETITNNHKNFIYHLSKI
jgi:RimJ/RimL family protein N-acetyltransferase